MTRRRTRDLLIGLLLTGVTFVGVLYQVNESQAEADGRSGDVPRLLCPLH